MRTLGDLPVDIGAELRRVRAAQQNWAARPIRTRLGVIQSMRRAIARDLEALERAAENGRSRPPGASLAAEVAPLLETAAWLVRCAAKILADDPRRRGGGPLWRLASRVRVVREPHGVVLIIGPSNYPLGLAGVQVLHALAAGNGVVWKPGRGGGSAARVLARIAEESGLPKNLLLVLDESPESARAAIEAGVDKVVLTGSAQTGAAVLADLAPRLTPSVMELSGCDAVFVLPGADPDLVVRAVAFGMCLNDGATCIGPHRLFARQEMLDVLAPRLVAACEAMGACRVEESIARRVRRLAREAVREGARLMCGSLEDGEPYRPILLDRARPTMALLQADTFAPTLSLVSVADEHEAIGAAAQCPFALGATVFGPPRKAAAFARRVPAGLVLVNDMIAPLGDPRVPLGARGRSGFGVTRGAEGLLEMTRLKAVVVSRGRARPHFAPWDATTRRAIAAYLVARHGATWWERLGAWWHAVRAVRRRRHPSPIRPPAHAGL